MIKKIIAIITIPANPIAIAKPSFFILARIRIKTDNAKNGIPENTIDPTSINDTKHPRVSAEDAIIDQIIDAR